MTTEETIVALLGTINAFLLLILIYLRFLWNLQTKIWHHYWMERYGDVKAEAELRMGDTERGEQGVRSRDLYRPQG